MGESIRNEFVKKIESAFAHTPYPGVDRLAAGYWPFKDSDKLVRDLKGQHWSELSRDVLFRYRGSLGGFTPDAFRFYLPALLRTAVLYPVEMDTLLDSLFFYLVPPESFEKSRMDELRVRANAFSKEEMEVILAYFETYAELYPDDAEFLTDSDRSELQRAIEFWKSMIE